MRFRAARTLVFVREEGELVAYNFLAGSSFACSPDLLVFLAMVEEWAECEDLIARMPAMPPEELRANVESLIDVGAITVEGSELAADEAAFRTGWRWGIPAALFHFSLAQSRPYLSVDQAEALQRSHLAECPQPELYLTHDGTDDCVRLPEAANGSELMRLMGRRRTIRSAAATALTIKQLSDCLFAGLGITGQTQNCVGTLPLSMTPSGGARNPYEAYVLARTVEGLAPGLYHYAAIDHTLAPIDAKRLPTPSELMSGQEWADQVACVIVLCALLERTMWKYDDPNAYRVVLIEAGHIGQNVMLAATSHGLSACPSAALDQALIRECIGSGDRLNHTAVYALTLAVPGQTA